MARDTECLDMRQGKNVAKNGCRIFKRAGKGKFEAEGRGDFRAINPHPCIESVLLYHHAIKLPGTLSSDSRLVKVDGKVLQQDVQSDGAVLGSCEV